MILHFPLLKLTSDSLACCCIKIAEPNRVLYIRWMLLLMSLVGYIRAAERAFGSSRSQQYGQISIPNSLFIIVVAEAEMCSKICFGYVLDMEGIFGIF